MKKDKVYTIYGITLQGKVMYVGKTSYYALRKWQHLHYAGKKWDANNRKRSAIPDGISPVLIDFVILETADNEQDALKAEDKYIQEYDTINNGWNQVRSGNIMIKDPRKYDRDRYHKIKERKHKYYVENKEHILALSKIQHRRYYQEHKEEINAKRREDYKRKHNLK